MTLITSVVLVVVSVCAFYPSCAAGLSPVNVHSAGVLAPAIGETALKFYIEVHNGGWYALKHLRVDVERCCLNLADYPCLEIPVLGGQRDVLQPSKTANLTLLYPTLYLFNRVGNCKVTVTHDGDYTFQHEFSFNTSVPHAPHWVPRSMSDWWYELAECSTIDQDPLHHCRPVNCLIKYNGQLNYYNSTSHLCQKPASCLSDGSNKELPDKAFNRQYNYCKDLLKPVTPEDWAVFHSEDDLQSYDAVDLLHMFQHVCVHGEESSDGRSCICSEGWTNPPPLAAHTSHRGAFNPTTRIKHFCSVPVPDVVEAKQDVMLIILVVMVCLAMIAITSLVIMKGCCRKKKRKVYKGQAYEMEALVHKDTQPVPSTPKGATYADSEPRQQRVFYKCARVQIPNKGLLDNELDLQIGDIITGLKQTSTPGYWQGRCGNRMGVFPHCCAQFYKDENHMRISLGQ